MWRCTHNRICNAKLKILGNRILREDRHSCLPIEQKQLSNALKKECIEQAKNNYATIPQIYKNVVKQYIDSGLNIIEETPAYNAVKASMYRARNTSFGVNKTQFYRAKDVLIPTVLVEDFLLYDYNQGDRILIFATKEARKFIEERQVFLFDGTFKVCPAPFYQIYSMHTEKRINNSNNDLNIVPVLFALLTNKTEETYNLLYKLIKKNCQNGIQKKLF